MAEKFTQLIAVEIATVLLLYTASRQRMIICTRLPGYEPGIVIS